MIFTAKLNIQLSGFWVPVSLMYGNSISTWPSTTAIQYLKICMYIVNENKQRIYLFLRHIIRKHKNNKIIYTSKPNHLLKIFTTILKCPLTETKLSYTFGANVLTEVYAIWRDDYWIKNIWCFHFSINIMTYSAKRVFKVPQRFSD